MKKRNWKVIILITVIITVLLGGTATACAFISNKYIANGDRLLLEGEYNEALDFYEKALSVNKINKKAKASVEVVKGYKKAVKLFDEGEYVEAKEKLEALEEKQKFSIIENLVSETSTNIEYEIAKDGLGNTIGNLLNGGIVAYKGNYIIYSNPNDEDKLYKRNINTNKDEKISDDKARHINIYKNYIYYVDWSNKSNNNDNGECEVKRVTFDGEDIESVIPESKKPSSIQIIDDKLYYSANYEYIDGFNYSDSYEIYIMDLNTAEVELLGRFNMSGWILNKDLEGNVNFYYNHRYSVSMVKDILNGGRKSQCINSSLWNSSIVGVDKENIYYQTIHLDDAMPGVKDTDGIIKTNIETGRSSVVYSTKNFLTGKNILLGEKIYKTDYDNKEKLISIDISTSILKEVDTIDIAADFSLNDIYFYSTLFNVKDYIVYYNNKGELIINKNLTENSQENEQDKNEEDIEEFGSRQYNKKINKIKKLIEETVKDDVVFYRESEIKEVVADEIKTREVYSFGGSKTFSPYIYFYDEATDEVLLATQAMYWNVTNSNVEFIGATNGDGLIRKQDLTQEQLDLYNKNVKKIITEDTRFNEEGKFNTIIEDRFEDCLHYIICKDEVLEKDGIKLQLVKINLGQPNYDVKSYYVGDNGKFYSVDDLIDNGVLKEL